MVPAAEAQILYSLVPLPAGLLAALLPGGSEELLGIRGYLGGALIIGASVAAGWSQQPDSSEQRPEQQALLGRAGSTRGPRASRRSGSQRRGSVDPEDP